MDKPGEVYVQTNDAAGNQVIAYGRAGDGTPSLRGRYDTGGLGTGEPHLASQGSVTLTDDGRWLLVVNAGSNDVSVLTVGAGGLDLAGRASSGEAPISVAAHEGYVYVLNSGGESGKGSISGFAMGMDGTLEPLPGSTRPLSQAGADPAQVAFSPDGTTLVVTEKATNGISLYPVGENGVAEGPVAQPSSGVTPYGFGFTRRGTLVVTEAFGARAGAAAVSSYALVAPSRLAPISTSVGNTRTAVCWAVISKDDRFAFVTNFGDGTVSSYRIAGEGSIELHDPVAATTVPGEKGIRDVALTSDGRHLYAIHADMGRLYAFQVSEDGRLVALGMAGGLPATVAGLAAS